MNSAHARLFPAAANSPSVRRKRKLSPSLAPLQVLVFIGGALGPVAGVIACALMASSRQLGLGLEVT